LLRKKLLKLESFPAARRTDEGKIVSKAFSEGFHTL
jgi:hypothetical protein